MVRFFNTVFKKYTPDPFVIAALLTFFVVIVGTLSTPNSPVEMVTYWGGGFWKIIAFTLQMIMILVGGYIIAVSPPIQALLRWMASKVKNSFQAIILVTLISCVASWLNWGLGLVVGAFVALELARHLEKINFKVLVASAYTGFIVWHGGLSGSIPLVVNSDSNFSSKLLNGVIPISETLFSHFNLIILATLLVLLPSINWYLYKSYGDSDSEVSLDGCAIVGKDSRAVQELEPSEKLERHPTVTYVLVIMAALYIGALIGKDKFQLDLNQMNFLFFFAGLALHGNPKSFIDAAIESSSKVGPLIIQYPLYAGIMAMISQSGLAANISEFFISISTENTFPVWTFFSAGLVNVFVPSGGGQWALQAPIVIPAAKALGVDMGKAVMSVAWGDAWTNLLQPFWALPVLAIAGLKVKDIMAHCVLVLLCSGGVIALLLYLL